MEKQSESSLEVQWVQDPALSLQWLGSLLWHKFDPWPRYLHMLVGMIKETQKQKQKQKTKNKKKNPPMAVSRESIFYD